LVSPEQIRGEQIKGYTFDCPGFQNRGTHDSVIENGPLKTTEKLIYFIILNIFSFKSLFPQGYLSKS
jgi:hypothetical protein